jgi:arylsulfatase A-like enzyme
MKIKHQRTQRRQRLGLLWIGLAPLTLSPAAPAGGRGAVTKPSILLIVADNLGRESVGYYGNRIHATPHLDKLASAGVVFDQCLIAAPLCAPARCGWNTGRHPLRVGINDKQPSPKNPESGLSPKEITIAQLLKGAGYDTALVGKWNLGYAEKFNPRHFGFDQFYGSLAGHADYYTHVYNSDMKIHFYRDLTPVNDRGYFDELFTDEAVRYLQARKGNPRPFYLNLCFYAPHGPYQAPPGYYHSDDREVNYQHMVEYLDTCVGRVLAEVDRLGLAENTLIVFLSDQGGSFKNDYGRTLREPSLKVVCNAAWKGVIPAGKRIGTPWLHVDLFAVFAGLAGVPVPQDRVIDAQDIWPLFEGREWPHDRTFFWKFHKEDAVRQGDWKLHLTGGKVDGLFNLASDPEEKDNLASRHPGKVEELQARQAKWKAECLAQQTSQSGAGVD